MYKFLNIFTLKYKANFVSIKNLITCFFIAISWNLFGQQKPNIDSLKVIISSITERDTTKVKTYVLLAHELRWVDIKEASIIANKGLTLSKKINYYSGESSILAELARIYNQIGNKNGSRP